eukprot:COSAG02_NODE_5508_length_4271_cov_1.557047_6_plen_57_part_00
MAHMQTRSVPDDSEAPATDRLRALQLRACWCVRVCNLYYEPTCNIRNRPVSVVSND